MPSPFFFPKESISLVSPFFLVSKERFPIEIFFFVYGPSLAEVSFFLLESSRTEGGRVVLPS